MKSRIVVAAVLIALLGAGAYLTGLVGGGKSSTQTLTKSEAVNPPRQAAPAIAARAGATPGAAGDAQRSAAVPEWAKARAGAPSVRADTKETAHRPDAADTARQAAVDRALDRLMALQAKEKPAPAEVAAALSELERAHGSSNFHGLKLDALRTNIEVSQRMSEIASQLEAMQPKSGNAAPTPEMMAKVKELQGLQAQLRTDLTVQGSAGAPR